MKFIKDNSQTMAEWINAVLNKNCVQKEDIKFSGKSRERRVSLPWAALCYILNETESLKNDSNALHAIKSAIYPVIHDSCKETAEYVFDEKMQERDYDS